MHCKLSLIALHTVFLDRVCFECYLNFFDLHRLAERTQYYKLKARRGAKKAIVAIAHRIAKAIYNIIKHGDRYRDLGEEYLSKPNKQRMLKNLAKKADELGMKLVPCEG